MDGFDPDALLAVKTQGEVLLFPPIGDKAPLGSGELGVLDLGQSLPLELLCGPLDLIEGL